MGMENAQGKHGCEVCGKEQEKYFEVHLGGERHVFDTFECAMHGLMPRCRVCGVLILGPGLTIGDVLYCSESCADLPDIQTYEDRLYLRE